MVMRALAKTADGPGNVELVDGPTPSPGPGEVLVAVHGSGVCGTDLHIEDAEYSTDPPVTMGHEVSGLVAALGDQVSAAWLGERVVCETFFATCGNCEWCRDAQPNLCPTRRSIGSHADGGFAEYMTVPAHNLHRIPDWLDSHTATLAEPLACVCNCLLDPNVVQPGDSVVVTGPGPVGLLAAQVAKHAGADVLVCGLPQDAERLAVAAGLGLKVTDEPPDAQSAHVVIECSGSPEAAGIGLRTARRGGRYVQVGVFGRAVQIPFDIVLYSELTVTSGFASTPRSWRHAINLIETGAVDLAPLVTRAEPLSAWQEVFADLRQARGLKLVLDPRL